MHTSDLVYELYGIFAGLSKLVTAFAALLSAFAWPLVVIVLAFRFSRTIVRAVESLMARIVAGDDLDLVFGKAKAKIRRVASKRVESIVLADPAAATSPESLTAIESTLLNTAIVLGPSARVAASLELVLRRLVDFASERGVNLGQSPIRLDGLLAKLRKGGLLEEDLDSALADLDSLTALIRTIPERGLDDETVTSYQALANAILALLSSDMK